MDDRRFDALVRSLAVERSRRSALKALLGIGSIATVGAIVLDDVEAARRGEPASVPTPRPTTPPSPPTSTQAAPTQVPPSATAACPGVLCAGGCCDGQCTSTGACCPAGSAVCGPDCCPNGQAECCDNACCYGACYGEELCCPTGRIACNGVCLPLGGCCSDADCSGARCLQNVCIAFTPTNTPQPTVTATATPVCREDSDCGACTCSNDGRDITCPNCFDGNCVVTPALCPDGTSCVGGECRGFMPTGTSTETATSTATSPESATPSSTATSVPTETATATATNGPTETATPSGTATGTATVDPNETGTSTATTAVPSMSAFLLNLTDRCYVVVELSGFPPNGLVNLSMAAFKDDNFFRFVDDQFYFDIPVGQDGTLQYAMGPVWVDRDPFVNVTVLPFADSPATGQVSSIDFVPLPESCNPND
jgi:hypothetical protein